MRRKLYSVRDSIGLSVTTWLIIANVVFSFLFFLLIIFFRGALSENQLIRYVALRPENIFRGGYLWTLLTHMFVHGSVVHLFVNMVSLFFIGNLVEQIIGRKRFFPFYFIAGFSAAFFFILCSLFYAPDFSSYAVGASGAIFGIATLLAVLIPKLRVYVFFVVPMPLWLAIIVLLFGLWAVSFLAGLPIGNTAHLGGALAGLVYGLYLRKKYRRKVGLLRRYFSY